MDCDIRKQLQRQFYYFGTYFLEDRVIGNWTALAADARVVFDVGANAGIYSLAATVASPLAQVYAFEPTPEIAAHLKASISLNGLIDRLQVHESAVGAEDGSIWLNFFQGEKADNEGMNFVSSEPREANAVEVPVTSLDIFCSNAGIGKIDLLKVDVQGHEPAVFDGARGLIERKAVKTIFFELNWNRNDPTRCPARRAVKTLAEAGYCFADARGPMEFKPAGGWLEQLSDVVAQTG